MRTKASAALNRSAEVFSALGDHTRLRLVTRLCREGPLSIAALAKGEPISRQGVTKHLTVLEGAGLVHGDRDGRETRWELNHEPLDQAQSYLRQISEQWDAAIDRLRNLVEEP